MTPFARSPRAAWSIVIAAMTVSVGCGPEAGTQAGSATGGRGTGGAMAAGTGGAADRGSGGVVGPMGSGGISAHSSGGAPGSGGVNGTGGVTGSGGMGTGGAASGGRGGGGTATGGFTTGGAGGLLGTGGVRAGSGGVTGTGGIPNCTLPATVSYQRDVQAFLIKSCGGGNGCHVIDTQSTVAAGGFNHGYDWITAGAHAFSCPNVPKRFEVVIDVINQANPATCSKSRKMPPPDATGAGVRDPLTPCQIATLQAWLNEPLVTQMHRADDSSPTTPYPMPPFN